MASTLLQVFDERLTDDTVLADLLPRVMQLRSGRSQVIEFANRLVHIAQEVNNSVRSCIQFVIRMVRETERLPATRFEVVCRDGGHVLVNTQGAVLSLDSTGQPSLTSSATGLQACSFQGIEGIQWKGYGNLQKLIAAGKLNCTATDDFLGADDRLRRHWHLDSLFQFYGENGSELWLAPVRDFSRLDHSVKTIDSLRKGLLDILINAGELGFCPTQFLRRVILPQIRKCPSPQELHRVIDPMFCMLIDVQTQLQRHGGDGSAANLFTLKYFAHNIAQPTSKLLVRNFYDRRGTSSLIFDALGACWVRLFGEGPVELKKVRAQLIRSYIHPYLNALVRIENPYEIRQGFERMTEHVLVVSQRLWNRYQASDLLSFFHFGMHQHAFSRLEDTYGPNAHLLKLLAKHMEVVEHYAAQDRYDQHYITYLNLLGQGVFKSPEDIDFYLNAANRVSPDVIGNLEGLNFLSNMLARARTPEAREELLTFMEESPFLEDSLYATWQKAQPDQRKELLENVDFFFHSFLYAPWDKEPALPSGVEPRRLRCAIIAKLVRSSALTKPMILEQLGRTPRNLPGVTAAFQEALSFPVPRRAKNETGLRLKKNNLIYLQTRLGILQRVQKEMRDPAASDRILESLCDSAYQQKEQLLKDMTSLDAERSRAIGSAGQSTPELEKRFEGKKRGLTRQMSSIHPFTELISQLKDQPRLKKSALNRAILLALLGLMYDKGFSKKHSEEFGQLVLLYQYRTLDPLALGLAPYSTVEGLDPSCTEFDHMNLSALEAIYDTLTHDTFLTLCHIPNNTFPNSVQAGLDAFYSRIGLGSLKGAAPLVRADFFHRVFTRTQGIQTLRDLKQKARKSITENAKTVPLALVPGRYPMDQFFGAVGENCTARHYSEVKRKDFLPVRIVQSESHTLEGYIHLLAIERDGKRILLVPGIEPKTSLIDHLDPLAFYKGVRAALVHWARKGGYDLLAYSTNWITWSNREHVLPFMRMEVEAVAPEKLISLPGMRFPEDAYSLQYAAPIWEREASAAALP